MTTSKKASGKKAARKQGGKGPARGGRKAVDVSEKWRFTADEEFEHSPIIITDGSASIEFDLDGGPYDHQGGGQHTSTGLRLNSVSANMIHDPNLPPGQASDPPGTAICHSFSGLSQFRIEVTIRVDNVDETFTIRGRNTPISGSPSIEFNINRFVKDHANFPPKFGSGTRFVNPGGNIVRLRIFRGNSPNPVHDCPLAGRNGVEYTVDNPHVFV